MSEDGVLSKLRYRPMLAKSGDEHDLDNRDFVFEPKLDGTRAICYFNRSQKSRKGDTSPSIIFINRREKNITHRYPEFSRSEFFDNIKAASCVLDGEIIVYDENGIPDFNLLQKREQLDNKLLIQLRSREFPATYVVFDILMKDGHELIGKPLKERKKILNKTVIDSEGETKIIQKIFFTKDGRRLFKEIRKRGLEGVMAKKLNGRYYPGERTSVWLKIKFLKTLDCIIVGYTSEKRKISSLALALYDGRRLKYVGRVGTGFTEKLIDKLHKLLKPLRVRSPTVEYRGDKKIIWVRPKLICEVKYLEFSKDKILRAPVFLRLRYDKPIKECTF